MRASSRLNPDLWNLSSLQECSLQSYEEGIEGIYAQYARDDGKGKNPINVTMYHSRETSGRVAKARYTIKATLTVV
jgi:hypothetical protein